ncbi:zinc ribbon domain-containing protein [Lyngbya sp. CCY1209]|uniref:zinc ribbon domain-containing protein n=1 Tax=Lyngbya sp. CCY1209 TaxID=2886103 RepID=UPI0035C93B6F
MVDLTNCWGNLNGKMGVQAVNPLDRTTRSDTFPRPKTSGGQGTTATLIRMGLLVYNSSELSGTGKGETTKRCSNCGHVKDSMPLSVRVDRCEKCSCESNRDLNAAQNLAMAGSLPGAACGSESADTSFGVAPKKTSNPSNASRDLGNSWLGLSRFFRAEYSQLCRV